MRAKHFSLWLLRFSLLLLLNNGVNSTNKVLPLWDLNEPAPIEEAEERQHSPTVSHVQSPRLEDRVATARTHDVPISESHAGTESVCEIHHKDCEHWKELTKKEKKSAKNKRYRKNAVSNVGKK
ncbi:uncharacterized protein FA14DRAFT_64021 [Meira miltonrushii]|uniref:Secreted protein n=1 Tax=Meira miltonrushii TaxID=1280837 RepID=A0A316V801_9BASI|nr:uncharacterized protein FA14DRAFT_64021 [Meira miltonrushii]PWN33630.1 hypothetical protein FA14DRAFT_64021 [Meira miltonrushii]